LPPITALYPGSFDPITNGHLDIIQRATRLFDKVIVGVYELPSKNLLFSAEERAGLCRESCLDIPNIEVARFSGLMVDYAHSREVQVIVRGLRMGADFEYEFDMGLMNKNLAPDVELICFMASLKYQFLRSSLLKEVARLGGNVDNLVPKPVLLALKKKLSQGKL
jgi:pantetheine-phosphate adenylyltransferase